MFFNELRRHHGVRRRRITRERSKPVKIVCQGAALPSGPSISLVTASD
jgi:hypothetical protein